MAVFTTATAQARVEDDFIADFDATDIGTKGLDDACGIGTQDVGHRQDNALSAFSDPDIEVIEPSRADAQEDFAQSGPGRGNILDLNVVQLSV